MRGTPREREVFRNGWRKGIAVCSDRMKILLDECLPVAFRHHLHAHKVHTVDWAGFKSLKFGHLLVQADNDGYEVLLTVDQGIPHQQHLTTERLRSSPLPRESIRCKISSPWLARSWRHFARFSPVKSDLSPDLSCRYTRRIWVQSPLPTSQPPSPNLIS